MFASMLVACFVAAGAQQPRLVSSEPVHDFGTVKQGEKVVHTFVLRNEGASPVSIQRVEFSAPGMTTRFNPTVPPGQQVSLIIAWDTSGAKGKVKGEAVVLLGDVAQTQVRLVLQGYVKAPIEFLPMGAVFFSVYKGDRADQVVTVVNNEQRPLNILRLEAEGNHFVANLVPVAQGSRYELKVTVPPGTPPGRYMEAVSLYTDHPQFARLRVPVNVLVKTDVYVNPETVEFGQISLNTLVKNPSLMDLLTQTFFVKKRQGKFEIKSVTSSLPFLWVAMTPGSPSETFRIDVGLIREQLRVGKISGNINIRTTDPRFPIFEVPVRGEIQ